MRTFLETREAEDAAMESAIGDLLDEANLNQVAMDDSQSNLLIQLLLKQGQVEIESSRFEVDFSNTAFLHRSVLEDLNFQIKHFGTNKIDAMLESRDFRKGIHLLEWERKNLEMTTEDLQQKALDIQMLKLTRELQSVLTGKHLKFVPVKHFCYLTPEMMFLKFYFEN
jgi:hypothetical protein